ncbi:hypothetical protein NMY22_g11517 [Coprinellus aureogranulatus]|nr:hypothetical protein NMY22_g11517 [Coprinellus aureogranulatus]
MDGFVFLAPLAIVGYAGAVLALGIIIRYSGSQKLPIQLETVSGSSSSLPSPASSSSSSLKSTILRGVKSTTSTLKVAVRIPVQAVPRWSSLTELIAKRWRKRIMLEQLPTIASEDDNPVPPAPATPEPVLVDLTEASTVSSPFLPLHVLGTSAPIVRSHTPLPPTSASNVLATSRSSIFTLDSYSVPSTPPPYRGHQHAGHRYEAVSPFASPRSHASRVQEPGTYVPRSASPIVGLPHSRPRTPSPIYNNPHFLATSPVLRNHRRTRSFGGISVKRVAATPAIPVNLPRNGSGTFVAVESCKESLTRDPKIASSVDWLTEVIRRYSDAALAARPFTTVNMKHLARLEKWKKYETPIFDKPFSHEEVVAFEDAIALHGPELRAVRDEVTNRSMPEIVRFYGHWKNSKLKEENERIRTKGPPPKPVNRQYRSEAERGEGLRVGLSDDEGSIVAQPSKSPSCGACRTRESSVWWKAPKGLSTNVLCDACGNNWRRYADLNVRPIREESAPTTKSRAIEKREGTPLTAPSSKRARVSVFDVFSQ